MNETVPTVPGDPLLGNLPEFRIDRIGLLRRVPEKYGDVARLRLGFFFQAFLVSSPDLARQVLVDQDEAFEKSLGLTLFAKPLLGNGLITSKRDLHRRQRRMMAPAFTHGRIAGYADTIAAYADRAATRMARRGDVDVSEEMMRLTLEIVGKTLFDADLAGDAVEVREALTAAMELLTTQVSSALPFPPFVPTPGNLRASRVVRRLDEVVYRLIRDRRASRTDAKDLLSMLLAAQDEDGSVMTDQQVRDEAMNLLLAGHETVANALAWTFYSLARNPDVRRKLEDEVDRVLGGELPGFADLPRLPYTLQVFKESMRLHPPVYMVLRRALHRVSIGRATLEKGQIAVVDIIGMHHRPQYFPEPLAFRPERFEKDAEKALPKQAYLPFGAGSRICIGNHFALMEGHLALARLAQRLRFELVDPSREIRPEPLITLRPKGGVRVRVVARARRSSLAQSVSEQRP